MSGAQRGAEERRGENVICSHPEKCRTPRNKRAAVGSVMRYYKRSRSVGLKIGHKTRHRRVSFRLEDEVLRGKKAVWLRHVSSVMSAVDRAEVGCGVILAHFPQVWKRLRICAPVTKLWCVPYSVDD